MAPAVPSSREPVGGSPHHRGVTPHIAVLIGLIVLALVFFSFEWIASDVVALGLLLALVYAGLTAAASS